MHDLLPVTEVYNELVENLASHHLVLLQAPPGAGKSTWLPLQLIRDKHFKHIIMLEPRRLAARNIAQYLAQCQNEKVGESIGLSIRHEKLISKNTQLEIVTEGMLTRMIQKDPELTGIDCIIFDEYHERSISADLSLAFALEAQATLREDLKILLMSATLDSDKIQQRFNCPVISSNGRSYPIDEIYQPLRDEKKWLEEVIKLIPKALKEQTGSCLVFLPGQREINKVYNQLNNTDENITVYKLHGGMGKTEQQAAIAKPHANIRKIVLTTNVAETSLTIEGVRIVIDSGKKRAAIFNLNSGVSELKTINISQSSAIQRAGRAGRIEAGVVYRLGSKESFHRREKHDIPEILSNDISSMLLETKQWGSDIQQLTLLDTPSIAQQQKAKQLLIMLEAINSDGKLTPLGVQMSQLGSDIRLAHMLVKAQQLEKSLPGIYLLAANIISLMESRVSNEAELITAIQQQAKNPHPSFSKQLSFWLKRCKLSSNKNLRTEHLALLIALAYPDRIAQKRGKGYILSSGIGAEHKEGYWLNDQYITIADLGGQSGQLIFSATAVDIHSLQEYLPHLFNTVDICEYSEKENRFIYEERQMLGSIIVRKNTKHTAIDDSIRQQAWKNIIEKNGFSQFENFHYFEQLLIRMTLAHAHYPEHYSFINENYLLDNLDTWLTPYLNGIKKIEQLRQIDILSALKNYFNWQQQNEMNDLLPSHLPVPSGSTIAIKYSLDSDPKLSVRIQEIYGVTETPKICNGKLTLLIDLLSPAQRSIQLTQDLASFWQGSYKEIQKEMKGKYPKHFWPDDPATAQATHKTKKYM